MIIIITTFILNNMNKIQFRKYEEILLFIVVGVGDSSGIFNKYSLELGAGSD